MIAILKTFFRYFLRNRLQKSRSLFIINRQFFENQYYSVIKEEVFKKELLFSFLN